MIENVGHDLADETCKGLAKFLNDHVLSSGNKITLRMPTEKFDVGGIYITRVSVEIEETPCRPFKQMR